MKRSPGWRFTKQNQIQKITTPPPPNYTHTHKLSLSLSLSFPPPLPLHETLKMVRVTSGRQETQEMVEYDLTSGHFHPERFSVCVCVCAHDCGTSHSLLMAFSTRNWSVAPGNDCPSTDWLPSLSGFLMTKYTLERLSLTLKLGSKALLPY